MYRRLFVGGSGFVIATGRRKYWVRRHRRLSPLLCYRRRRRRCGEPRGRFPTSPNIDSSRSLHVASAAQDYSRSI
ncbi:unnamed protein product [Linum trigynum]|uniref:Uncharacterized protein n=1 Tax=Linum trigynum TaxID=586398 RepID=A0AAV2D1R8_9ROSI